MTEPKTKRACPVVQPTAVRQRQCKACPWKVSTVPERDIPGGYGEELHKGLKRTISAGVPSLVAHMSNAPAHLMQCHETTDAAKPQVCAGWLLNQLGPGNNLGLRMMALGGHFGNLRGVELDGEQHETFEATLPKKRAATRARRAK